MNKNAQQIVPDRTVGQTKKAKNDPKNDVGDASGDYGQKTIPTKRFCKANDSDDVEVIFEEATVTEESVNRARAAQATQAKRVLWSCPCHQNGSKAPRWMKLYSAEQAVQGRCENAEASAAGKHLQCRQDLA